MLQSSEEKPAWGWENGLKGKLFGFRVSWFLGSVGNVCQDRLVSGRALGGIIETTNQILSNLNLYLNLIQSHKIVFIKTTGICTYK